MLRLFCVQGQDSASLRNTATRHLPLGVPSNNRRFIESLAPTICSRGSRSMMK